MLGHVHVLANVQQLCSCVCISRSVDLECVGWDVMYAEELLLQCSLVRGSSTSLFCGSLWIDRYSSCPIRSGKLTTSGHQCTLPFIYLRVGHLSAVFRTSHHHLCSRDVSSAVRLLSASSVATSTNIERHSHQPQRQGYQISILNHTVVVGIGAEGCAGKFSK